MQESVKRIKEIMEDKSLTSKGLALKIGVQASTLSHYFTGRNSPSAAVINKILSAFPEINPDWMYRGALPKYLYQPQAQENGQANPQLQFSQTPQSQASASAVGVNTNYGAPYAEGQKEPLALPINAFEERFGANKPQPISLKQGETPQTVIKEIVKEVPSKIITRIVVYYSDNTYEDFLAR